MFMKSVLATVSGLAIAMLSLPQAHADNLDMRAHPRHEHGPG
jgi:hypothetical protein